jgi:hypothetical protein
MPPAPVPIAPPANQSPPAPAPTALFFSDALRDLPVSRPDLRFRASLREAPQNASFRVAVDSLGIVRYSFLERPSGDPALDEQARHCLALCRFHHGAQHATDQGLIWARADFEFGSDLELPPAAAERAP